MEMNKSTSAETDKYPGKHIFLHEEAPNLYVAYNFFHKEIGRGTLEELVPVIREYELLPKLGASPAEEALKDARELELTALDLNLDDLLK